MEKKRHDYFIKHKAVSAVNVADGGLKGFLQTNVNEHVPDILGPIKLRLSVIGNLEDFHKLWDKDFLPPRLQLDVQWQNPKFLDDWDTDEGMGRQTLTGISPIH